jgi:DNA phosphorothioation-associated putative methyltransferase
VALTNYTAGKRVGRALYVHRSAVSAQAERFVQVLADAEARAGNFDWNAVRIADGDVTFLLYEAFEDAPFPALLASLRVRADAAVTSVDYRRRSNPPILHRKELLLPPDHPLAPKFRALTAAAEEHGLFADSHKIGTRDGWNKRIVEAGLVLRGHSLLPGHEEHVEVSRHKTAIVRGELSQPMQLMMRLARISQTR